MQSLCHGRLMLLFAPVMIPTCELVGVVLGIVFPSNPGSILLPE
jgi:hypothetical protein